jgi:hypothetical protein
MRDRGIESGTRDRRRQRSDLALLRELRSPFSKFLIERTYATIALSFTKYLSGQHRHCSVAPMMGLAWGRFPAARRVSRLHEQHRCRLPRYGPARRHLITSIPTCRRMTAGSSQPNLRFHFTPTPAFGQKVRHRRHNPAVPASVIPPGLRPRAAPDAPRRCHHLPRSGR